MVFYPVTLGKDILLWPWAVKKYTYTFSTYFLPGKKKFYNVYVATKGWISFCIFTRDKWNDHDKVHSFLWQCLLDFRLTQFGSTDYQKLCKYWSNGCDAFGTELIWSPDFLSPWTNSPYQIRSPWTNGPQKFGPHISVSPQPVPLDKCKDTQI